MKSQSDMSTSFLSRFGVLVRVAALAALLLFLFSVTAAAIAAILAVVRSVPLTEPVNLSGGVICGLIAWLFVLIFHIRKERLTLPVPDRIAFVMRLTSSLEELGYEVTQPADDHLIGKPSFAALLFGGAVRVQIKGNEATFSGPKLTLENLRNRLRAQRHIDNNKRTLEDSGWYSEQGLLQSVQIHFRVPAHLRPDMARDLIEGLTRAGASVQCDITIRAQQDDGMEAVLIEKMVRERVRNKGVAGVKIYKKPLLPEDDAPGSALLELGKTD